MEVGKGLDVLENNDIESNTVDGLEELYK